MINGAGTLADPAPLYFFWATMSENRSTQKGYKKWLFSDTSQGILTLILWLVSAALSLYTLFEFQMMVLRIFILCCSQNRWGFSVLRQWSSIFIIGVWLAFTIFTGEYHYQHVRERKSWRLFVWSYVVIVIVLLISLIIA
jgi:hypothetical protein